MTKTWIMIAALVGLGSNALATDLTEVDSIDDVQIQIDNASVIDAQFGPPGFPGGGRGGGFPGGPGRGGGWGPGGGWPGGGHGGGWPGGGPGGGTVQCESQGYRENFCPTYGARRVQLVQQLSHPPGDCVYGQTWTFDHRGIFVRGGCRAIFRVR